MSELRFHVEDGIGRIWVDRPQVLNALSREIIDDLDVLLNEIKDNKDVKVLIVGGEENFAAGADIKGMVECNPEEAKAFAFSTTYDKLMNLPIPTIAAIDGYDVFLFVYDRIETSNILTVFAHWHMASNNIVFEIFSI